MVTKVHILTHLHRRLDVDSAHEAILGDTQRDLHKRRVADAGRHLAAAHLLRQAVLPQQTHARGEERLVSVCASACAALGLALQLLR